MRLGESLSDVEHLRTGQCQSIQRYLIRFDRNVDTWKLHFPFPFFFCCCCCWWWWGEKQVARYLKGLRTYSPSATPLTKRWKGTARIRASSSAASRAAVKRRLRKSSCVTWPPWPTWAANKKSKGTTTNTTTTRAPARVYSLMIGNPMKSFNSRALWLSNPPKFPAHIPRLNFFFFC